MTTLVYKPIQGHRYTISCSNRSGNNSSKVLSNISLPVSSLATLSPPEPPLPPTMITTRSLLQNSPITCRHRPHGVIGLAMLLSSSVDNQLLESNPRSAYDVIASATNSFSPSLYSSGVSPISHVCRGSYYTILLTTALTMATLSAHIVASTILL
jgi:hypothetical protein